MRMKKILFFSLTLVALATASCEKITCDEGPENPCDGGVTATILDYTGLDGCGWVIRMNDNSVKEPINLMDFDLDLIDGQEVYVSYHLAPEMASFCMVGELIEIDCIKIKTNEK
jgi:hypothetical protein